VTTQQVITIAGAAIGSAVGFPQLGLIAGSLLGSTFAPTQKAYGPRLGDLRVVGTEPGPIPYMEGTVRTAGQIAWASTRREIATTVSQGKGGGGGAQSTTYTYEIDVLYLFSDCQMAGLTRIWANGKLIFNRSASADVKSAIASYDSEFWTSVTFYSGSSSQLPDPTYEAAVGVGNAPGYRGRATVMIKSMQLGTSGQIPNLTFELTRDATSADVSSYYGTFAKPSPIAFQQAAVYKSASYFLYNDSSFSPNFTILKSTGYGTPKVYRNLTLNLRYSAFAPVWVQTNGSPRAVYATFNGALISGGLNVEMIDAESGAVTPVISYIPASDAEVLLPYQRRTAYDEVQKVWVMCTQATSTADQQAPFIINSASTYTRCASITGIAALAAWSGMIYALVENGGYWRVKRYNYSGVFVDEVIDLAGAYGSASGGIYTQWLRVDSDGVVWAFQQYSGRLFKVTTVFEEVSTPANVITYNSNTQDGVFYCDGDFAAFGYEVTGVFPSFSYNFVFRRFRVPTPSPQTLQTVVERLCARATLTSGLYDATALSTITKPVRSLSVSQTTPVRQVLEQLASVYFFGLVASDKLYFRPRGGSSVATIPFANIGAGEGSAQDDPLNLKIANDLEIPAQVSLTYPNVDADFNTSTEYSDRLLTGQTSTSVVQTIIGMKPAEAKGTADSLVADAAASVFSTTISVFNEYARIEPTDIVSIVDQDGSTYRMRVTRKTESGPVISLDLVLDDASALIASGVTSLDYTSTSSVNAFGETTLRLLDIPILRDGDDPVGLYLAVAPTATIWPGASIYKSVDGATYGLIYTVPDKTTMGITTTALDSWSRGFVFDETSSVTVTLDSGTLASYTRDDIFNGTPPAYLIGSEILYARTATLVSAGVYTLTGLLRGMRGTEWAMTGHAAGENFTVLATSGLRREVLATSDIGALRYYKAPTVGRSLSTADAKTLTLAAVGKKPFSPVGLRGSRGVVSAGASNVQLLLHMNGSPMFADSSSAANVMAVYGGATTSFTQAKFGAASGLFNGTSSFLTAPTGTNFQFSGDFTVEAWIYPTTASISAGAIKTIFSHYTVATNTTGFVLFQLNNTICFFQNGTQITGGATLVANAWQHVALCRVGTSIRLFINGTQTGSTYTSGANFSDGNCFIGRDSVSAIQYFDGYMDDVRVTKGVGRYSANFTAPAAQFDSTDASFASVTLLLNMNANPLGAAFIDSSQYARTVTATGGAQMVAAQSKFGATSALFNGANAYLNCSSGAAFQFAGDFTVEAWIYPTTAGLSGTRIFFDTRSGALTPGFAFYLQGGLLSFYSNGVGIAATVSITANVWTHVALTRSGSSVQMWKNGVQEGPTGTFSANMSDGNCTVGKQHYDASAYFDGYVDELKVTNGQALYTATFTPPTEEFPEPWASDASFGGVVLLLHLDGTSGQTTTSDSSASPKTMTVSGCSLSTTAPKFGATSLVLGGSSQRVSCPGSTDFAMGSGDFTVEAWVKITNTATDQCIVAHQNSAFLTGIGFILGCATNLYNIQFFEGGSVYSTNGAATANVWQHVAATRSGGTLTLYVDGVATGSTSIAGRTMNDVSSGGSLIVGNRIDLAYQLTGYIDDVRITKGVARYGSSFSPSASRFPDVSASVGVDLSWDRRTRLAKNFTSGYAPLGEASEAYEVDVWSDNTYTTRKRTITTSTALANYSQSQQVTDFGAVQSTIYVDVYQISAVVGRGYKLRGAV
jgi:hypothetical protein